MSDETRARLYGHMADLGGNQPYDAMNQAKAILADPQPHIDALVEAGVLERTENGWWSEGPPPIGDQPAYRVLPPHVHDWRVAKIVDGEWGKRATADLRCAAGCQSSPRGVLLDEWPKYIGEDPS